MPCGSNFGISYLHALGKKRGTSREIDEGRGAGICCPTFRVEEKWRARKIEILRPLKTRSKVSDLRG